MNRKLVVILVVAGIVVILIGIILGLTLSSKKSPVPVCHCQPDEICSVDTGQCTKRTSCGPKELPSGALCSLADLKCDASTDFLWICNACPPGKEGKYCNCLSSERKNRLANVCQLPTATIPLCQDDGTWTQTPQPAPSCSELNQCVCNQGFTGPLCQYSRSATCSGHGDPDSNGNCSCDSQWAGGICSFNGQDPSTAWVASCYCVQGLVCGEKNTSQDLNQRAACTSDNCYCSLGPTSDQAAAGCSCCGC